jgi:alpha-beta hydrolase superfamily lysophospholipase
VPVVLLHGLAVNADLWDLPTLDGPDFRYRSLATVLHEAGYDIWLPNLRGHGAPHMLSTPPAGHSDWCVDHHILFDLPAVIDRVRSESRLRPLVIGASLGAMTLAGYLQGARLADTGGEQRIIEDADLARRRQQNLAGAVFAEFPAVLRWPASLYDERGRVKWGALAREWYRNDGEANFPFEVLARWQWLQALVAAAGHVPLHWFAGDREREPWYRQLPGSMGRGAARLERAAVQAVLQIAGTFTGATNHRAEVMLAGRRYCVEDMKAGVLDQLARCVRAGAFVSRIGSAEHVYSDHYELIESPTLVLQGGRDRIANADMTRREFFDRIASQDKTFRYYEEIAHGEMEAAPIATEKVYPEVLAWIGARSGTG